MFVTVNDFQDVLLTSRTKWRRHQAFDVKAIRIDKQMHHRLNIVRIGTTDVRGHQYAMPHSR